MFLSRKEQEQQILAFYRSRKKIPLCLDHGGDDVVGKDGAVSRSDTLGEVLDLFISREGQMMVKLKLDMDHPFYREISRSLFMAKENWGVSIWIKFMEDTRNGQISKALSHVALTQDPLFGQFGTFFYGYGVLEEGVNKTIGELFYQEGSGESFASKELKRKIIGMTPPALTQRDKF